MDISQQAVNETATIELDGPTGEPLLTPKGEPVSVTIYGPGSKVQQRAQAARNRRVVEAVRKGAKKMKDDEQRDIDATFLADCTASFNGFTYKDLTGHDQFKAAYMDLSIGYIAEQVNKAMADWSLFVKKPATA